MPARPEDPGAWSPWASRVEPPGGALPSTASLSCEDAVKAAAAAAAAFSVSMLSSLRSPLEEQRSGGDTDTRWEQQASCTLPPAAMPVRGPCADGHCSRPAFPQWPVSSRRHLRRAPAPARGSGVSWAAPSATPHSLPRKSPLFRLQTVTETTQKCKMLEKRKKESPMA